MRALRLRDQGRALQAAAVSLSLVAGLARCASTQAAPCGSGDQDGITGGSFTGDLVVDDDAFAPIILKSQNSAAVTLTLTNRGTKPHDLVFDCLATPNDNGCPQKSCFPDAASIGPLAPDASATTLFVTPKPEGIYTFHSDLPGDTQRGQYVVQ
jgi:hypothetical protein